MTNDKGILIRNIYYMLTYAFQILRQNNYEQIAAEEFHQIQDLFAAILAKGISQQLKQGLHREYITQQEELSLLRGRLNIPGTIRCRTQQKRKLVCQFDQLSENNRFHQILKTAITVLLQDRAVKPEHKAALSQILPYFSQVDTIDPSAIPWSTLCYQRSNRSYEMLLNICRFLMEGMLQTTQVGQYRMAAFTDEHMARLFEKFVLEYLRQHHPYLEEAKAAQVEWDLDAGSDEASLPFLPEMQTDIFLKYQGNTLIIDTKYYGKTMQKQYDRYTLHSGNLYQIFAYVKNHDRERTGRVAGMLLYAKTQESITPDCSFSIGGNPIRVKTLDLNLPFSSIAAQLDSIAESHFGVPICQTGDFGR